jgi:hypothetical protein
MLMPPQPQHAEKAEASGSLTSHEFQNATELEEALSHLKVRASPS